jgi:hypothetical protein
VKVKCTLCHQEKDLSEFYKNIRKVNGLESRCKECVLSLKKKRRNKNRAVKKSNSSKVLNIDDCTWTQTYITRSRKEKVKLKSIVEELFWLKE